MKPSRFIQFFIACSFLGIGLADFGDFVSNRVKAALGDISDENGENSVDETINSIFDFGRDALDDVLDDIGDVINDLTPPDNDDGGKTNSIDTVPSSQEELVSLFSQLDDVIDAIEKAGGSLTSDDVVKSLVSALDHVVDNVSDENGEEDVFETLLSSLIKLALDDLGVEAKSENIDNLVGLSSDVYSIIQTYSKDNETSPDDVINAVLDMVIEALSESSRLADIKCSLTQTGLTRVLGQNIVQNVRQARITDIVLFLTGCTEQEEKSTTSRPWPDTTTDSFPINDNLTFTTTTVKTTTVENNSRVNATRLVLSMLRQSFIDPVSEFLQVLKEQLETMRRELMSVIDDMSNNRHGTEDMDATTENTQPGLMKERGVFLRNFFKRFRDQMQETDPTSSSQPKQSEAETSRRSLLQRIRDRGTKFSERIDSDSISSVFPGNRIPMFVEETLASVANSSMGQNLNERAKTRVKALISLIESIFNSTYFQRIVSDSPEVSEEIPDDNMAGGNNVTVDPMTEELVQTARQVIQTANLSDPESIITTTAQVLFERARDVIEEQLRDNSQEILQGLMGYLLNNESLIARIVPPETLQTLAQGAAPLIETTKFVQGVTQIYSTSYNTSQRCATERGAVTSNVLQGKVWALLFLDSLGKLDTGILQGNTWVMGNFDQCTSVSGLTDQGDVIEGSFVKYKFKVPLPPGYPNAAGVTYQETGLPYVIWHVCLPASCSQKDATQIGTEFSESIGVQLVESTILDEKDPTNDPAFIIAILVLSILGFLCLIGTVVDVILGSQSNPTKSKKSGTPRQPPMKPQEEEGLRSPTGEMILRPPNFGDLRADLRQMEEQENNRVRALSGRNSQPASPEAGPKPDAISQMFLAFSLYTNIPDVLKAKHTPGDITCLHGIRVISISWVILGHCYFFAPQFGNISSFVDMSKWWTFHGILNAPFSVDTFFLLSGCLVSYIFLRSTSRAGGLKPMHMVLYYVHRYLRLTPLYALAILLFTGLTPYLEYGPFQREIIGRDVDCRKIWWWNLLYISNLRTDMEMCMGWSWYLPNDMQFYFLAPLVLVPLALGYKYIGLLVAFLKVACHLIMCAVMVEKYDANLYRNGTDFFIYIYTKPYTRCGPYAIGLALGYLLFKTKCKVNVHRALVVLGWVLSVGGGLTLLYLPHDNLKEYGIIAPTWSRDAMNAYEIVKKPLWALCVGWVIFACATGNGGVINSFLSWQAWIPLSRLTFGTYLSHVMVLHYFNNNSRTVAYFTYQYVIERYLATFVLSYFISWNLSLLIETPVRNLIKPKRKPTAKPDDRGRNPDLPRRRSNRLASTPSSLYLKTKVTAETLRTRNMYLPQPGVPAGQGGPVSPYAMPTNGKMTGPTSTGNLQNGDNNMMAMNGNNGNTTPVSPPLPVSQGNVDSNASPQIQEPERGNLYPQLGANSPTTPDTRNGNITEDTNPRKKVSFDVENTSTNQDLGNSAAKPVTPAISSTPNDQSVYTESDTRASGVSNQGFEDDVVVPTAPPQTPERERPGPSQSTQDFIRI